MANQSARTDRRNFNQGLTAKVINIIVKEKYIHPKGKNLLILHFCFA